MKALDHYEFRKQRMTRRATTSPLARAVALFDKERMPAVLDRSAGYLDLLGDAPPPSPGLGQNLMLTRFYPKVYGWWRPLAARLAMIAQGRAAERKEARRMLDLRDGKTVLDLACGPGNFTGWFGEVVGDAGLAVGVDASPTMLEQAGRDNARGPVAYLRADAEDLPFEDGSFDAICCFAALFLMAHPMRAIDEIARVVKPGGRVAILTSCGSPIRATRGVERVISHVGGVHVFGRQEITGALAARGLVAIEQRISGVAQFVSARRPS